MSFETEHWSSPNGCHQDCPACMAEAGGDEVVATKYVPQIGGKLPNGATVERHYQDADTVVVMCRTVDGNYVTWRLDPDGNAYWGHYFREDEEREAIKNFFSRCPLIVEHPS